MKNQNEEAQRLSHEESAHLTSNEHLTKLSEPSDSKNISHNLNINEIKENNNITNIHHSHNDKDMESRLKNFDPKKHFTNYPRAFNPHHGHSHNHDFSNPKYVFYFILGFIKMINMQIMDLYSGFTRTLDMLITTSKLPKILKRILHTKQILLIVYMFNIQYLLSSVDSIVFLNAINKFSLRFFVLSIVGLHVHYYFYGDRLFLEKDEELEKFVIKRNPQMMRGKCQGCGVMKVCRSSHCYICNKCVKKFQLHSDWYNICIGANNELLYGVTLFFTNGYIFVSDIIFWYYILVRADLLNYLILVFALFAFVGLYILFNSLQFLYMFFFQILFMNITLYEKNNSRMLTYLWDDRTNHIINPFNKGIQRNIEEMLINTFDVDIYSEYKNFSNQNLSEIIDDNITKKEENNYYLDDFSSYKLMISLVEHFDPLITSKKNIYKFVDGKEIINWNRLMIFTAFDITNSPFNHSMIKRAKMMIQQREMQMQNMKKNEKEEKIDNTENSENVEVIDNNNENSEKNENKEKENIDNKVEENHVNKENEDNENSETEKININDKNDIEEGNKGNNENEKL